MEKHDLPAEPMKERLTRRLAKYTDGDGNFIYEGEGQPDDRRGSNLDALLSYALKEKGIRMDKPLDYELFYAFLVEKMKFPSDLLFRAPHIWKKLQT